MKTSAKIMCILAVCALLFTGCAVPQAETPAESASAAVSSAPAAADGEALYTPGSYTGEGKGYTGPIRVTVTVDESRILSITVDEEQEGNVGKDVYPKLTEIFLSEGRAVDVVSGATVTSSGFIAAVSDALEKAKLQ